MHWSPGARASGPVALVDPTAAAKSTLRSLARRHRQLSEEIKELEAQLQRLTKTTAPALVGIYGVGPDTAATLLVTAGSNPERLHSDAAFAALCGVNPDTRFFRQDQPAPAEPRWRPPGKCRPSPHRRGQAALRPTDQGIYASPDRRGAEQNRGHSLPETLCRP